MTVWIVNPFDNLPPEGHRPQRYWLMARAFARAGHAVMYWTADFSHAHKARRVFTAPDGGVTPCPAAPFDGDGFRVVPLPVPPYRANISLRRLLSHRAFARRLARAMAASAVRPDLVIASTPPLAACAAALAHARRTGARFIADIMDAWPETFERLVPRPFLAPLRATARKIYRSADALTAVATRYADLARAYGAPAPARVFRHGIDLPPPPVPPPRADASLRLVYIGNLGASYDLETVIDAVAAAPDAELDIAGAGPKDAALRRRAAGCPRVRFHGYLPDDALRALMARADAGIVPMFPDSCVGIPYKLADYAAAGLRVVNSLPGETADLLAAHGAGTSYTAGARASFAAALRTLRAAPPAFDCNGFRAEFDATRIYAAYVAFATSL